MNRNVLYWIATILIALAFLSGGAANLFHVEDSLKGMIDLGYPVYFLTILGAWKLLGGLTLLLPRLPRLKEWAYAGIAFDLTGASFSHLASGHPLLKAIIPLLLLALALTSWALRPASRVLGVLRQQPV